MSTLKTNAAQIGQSLTATNNFTVYQPASPDGTVRWGVGNAGSVTDIVTLNSSGNVGIGITAPTFPLTIQSPTSGGGAILIIGQTNNERILVRSASNSGGVGTSVVALLTARGTQASPSAVQAGDQLGYYQLGGYDGVDYLRSAWIQGIAAENYSSTNRGSIMAFSTTPIGSTTIAERVRITSSGSVGISTSAPAATLEVAGSAFFGSSANAVAGSFIIQGKTNANWNYSNLNLIRSASNTATPRFVGLMLDGDDAASTTIGGYNAIWGSYDSAPTTGSTSSALNGKMIYGAYAGHLFYINGSEKARVDSVGVKASNLQGPALSVSRVATQSLTTATYTRVDFDTVNYDTASGWNSTSKAWTPNVAGYYQVNLQINGTSSNAGEYISTVWKNGAEFLWGNSIVSGSGRTTPPCSGIIYMNGTTDYIQGYFYSSAASSSINGSATRSTMTACLIRSA